MLEGPRLALRVVSLVLAAGAAVTACSGGGSAPDRSGDGGGGGPADGGIVTDDAGCAFAPAMPNDPAAPIPTHFVLFLRAQESLAAISSGPAYRDECASDIPGGAPGGEPSWGRCVAEHIVASVNDRFGELLHSSRALVAFDSLETVTDDRLAHTAEADTDAALDELRSSSWNRSGRLNVFVTALDGPTTGKAPLQQDYPRVSGALLLMGRDSGWPTMAHELGHVVGFKHVEGESDGPVQYGCCGGLSVPGLAECTNNIMCSAGAGATFDTCAHGAFLRFVLDCWLSGRGNSTCDEVGCALPSSGTPRASCAGAVGEPVTCTCAPLGETYSAPSCEEAARTLDTDCPTSAPPCDFFGAACPAGQACYLNAVGARCRPAGTLAAGAPCTDNGQCVPGAVCLAPDGGRQRHCIAACSIKADAPASIRCFDVCAGPQINLVSGDVAYCYSPA